MKPSEIIDELRKVDVVPLLDGDRIRLSGNLNRLSNGLLTVIRESRDELIRFMNGAVSQLASNFILPAPEQDVYPTSNAQKRIWILSQLANAGSSYNIVTGLHVKYALNPAIMQRALASLIRRHESLRTTFEEVSDDLVQRVHEDMNVSASFEDIREVPDTKSYLKAELENQAKLVMDLGKGPLFGIRVYQLKPDGDSDPVGSAYESAIILRIHHIISDGWSVNLFFNELFRIYNGLHNGRVDIFEKTHLQYKDYAYWLASKAWSEKGCAPANYWKDLMADFPEALNLSLDFARPANRTYEGETVRYYLDIELYNLVLRHCKKAEVTVFNFFRSILTILLSKYSGQKDIIIGTPVSVRNTIQLEQQIGVYVNTVPLRMKIDSSQDFRTFLRNVSSNSTESFRFQNYPFDSIIENLGIERIAGRNALFDVMLVFQDAIKLENNIDGPLGAKEVSTLENYLYSTGDYGKRKIQAKFDLNFNFGRDFDEKAYLDIEYATSLFREDTIRRFYVAFIHITRQVISNDTITIADIDYLSSEDHELLLSCNGYMGAYGEMETVVSMFEREVDRCGDSKALLFGELSMSYRELNERSNQLAYYLQDRYGIGRNDLVGIHLRRSEWLIISILGVLKSGGAYVPMDADYPSDRIAHMVADSGCRVVLDESELKAYRDRSGDYSVSNVGVQISQEDLIYVIYTSGSTGEPKGAMVKHGSFSNLVSWYRWMLEFGSGDGVLLMAPISFDLAQKNIFVPFSCGGRLCVTQDMYGDYGSLAATISRHGLTVVNAAPSAFYPLLDTSVNGSYGHLKTLRKVVLGGEPIRVKAFEAWLQSGYCQASVVNSYGPTECTDVVAWHVLDADDWSSAKPIAIGYPIYNTSLYILDDSDKLVPVGVLGEIVISGICVGKGYWGQEALTRERFVANPYAQGHLMYKSGDIGYRLSDGQIVYVGRKDSQMKIRGYRVEMGEIERAMDGHAGVEKSVVVGKSVDEEVRLYGYFVGDAALTAMDLRTYLSGRLPVYMIPEQYVRLSSFPLTPSGKIDRKLVSAACDEPIASGIRYESAHSDTERRMVAIWKEVLGVRNVGVSDDFFVLGGHSLKVTRLSSRIYKEFEVKLGLDVLFGCSLLQDQCRLIDEALKTSYVSIAAVEDQWDYVLSSSQRRLWVLSQLEGSNVSYNMSGAYIMEGALDIAALSWSFGAIIDRHESLRTVFEEDDSGQVRQRILPELHRGFEITRSDLRSVAEAEVEEVLDELLEGESLEGFDLSAWPLLRCRLVCISESRWVFSVVMHHIISDGWSMEILIEELHRYYNALLSGERLDLPALRIHYKDYAVWQQAQLSSEEMLRSERYWLDQFGGDIPVLDLPTDYKRAALRTYRGGVEQLLLDKAEVSGLEALCQQQGATLFMGVLALVNALLYHYTGQQDLIIGSAVAGRDHVDLEDQVGFYVNTIALRNRLSGLDSFADLLRTVKSSTLNAYEHQQYPFDELVEKLPLPRDMSRHPLFGVMVVWQNMREGGDRFSGQEMKGLCVQAYQGRLKRNSKFDVLFDFMEVPEGTQLTISYNSNLFMHETISRMKSHLARLLSVVVADPSIAIAEQDYLSESEKNQLLNRFNETATDFPKDKTIVDLFRQQVQKTPDRLSLKYKNVRLTYADLDEKSDRLCNYLIRSNLQPGDLVGIMLERSENAIIAILGILKSGTAYVPIDPKNPAERKQFVFTDTNMKMLLTASAYSGGMKFFGGIVLNMDHPTFLSDIPAGNVKKKINHNDLAYVIYTSGSTGQPKGVMITHGALVDYFYGIMDKTNIHECRSFGMLSTISADLGNTVLYTSLLIGGTLHLFTEEEAAIPESIISADLDCLKIVPSHWKALQAAGRQVVPSKCLIFGGEQLSQDIIKRIEDTGSGCQVYNHYGPSETTIGKLIKRISLKAAETEISLGKPFCDSKVYILNERMKLLPIGVAGEICIGGSGLAIGYLNREDLTREKFVDDPYRVFSKLYRTGDLGRWLPDGSIAFIGRKDFQLKVRGYRVEPGEIESVLKSHPFVEAAVVIALKNDRDEHDLVAYVCLGGDIGWDGLRDYLLDRLPVYMLPSYYVELESMPLTSNGKIDRSRLPQPSGMASRSSAYVEPRNETDRKLLVIWEQLLGVEGIGIGHHFFELGGHSLKAIRLSGLVHKEFGVRLKLQDIFSWPVLRDQSDLIGRSVKSLYESIPCAKPGPRGYPLSSSQRRLWVLSQFAEGNTAYNMPGIYVFEGDLDVNRLQSCFDLLLNRHEILRTAFREDEQGAVWQQVQPSGRFRIGYEDLRHNRDKEAVLRQRVSRDISVAFDLSEGPLLRSCVYQVDGDRYVLTYVMHHIISDGWSLGVMLKELLLLYHRGADGSSAGPALRIQYKDYASWQREQLMSGALDGHRSYWLEQLSGPLPVLELPSDHARPAVKSYRGRTLEHRIESSLLQGLRGLLKEEDSTLFMGLVSVLNVLLYRYSGQEDIVIGSPVAGRDHAELEDQLGFYVNMVALRSRFSGTYSYRELLRHVRQVSLEAYEHQTYPFDELVDDLQLQRDMSRHPIFDVLIVLQIDDATSLTDINKRNELTITKYEESVYSVSKFDLSFIFYLKDNDLYLLLEYSNEIFTENNINQLARHFSQLAEAIVHHPDKSIDQLDFLTNTEKEQLFVICNSVDSSKTQEITITDMFEREVEKYGAATALVCGQKTFSFNELNQCANKLANYLKYTYKIQPNDLIGICLQRTEWLIISILGILKSGAAYVPIDPDFPQQRINYMVEDSGCKALINDRMIEDFTSRIDEYSRLNLSQVSTPADLAYVIYTSGSTGRPKGVMIEQRNVVSFFGNMTKTFGFTRASIMAATTNYTFDISVLEILGAMVSGVCINLYGGNEREDILEYLNNNDITALQLTPSRLNQLLELAGGSVDKLKKLELLLIGGEALGQRNYNLLKEMMTSTRVINVYGPTETTIWSSYLDIGSSQELSIGRPLLNESLYVLDRNSRLVPTGVIGEICIGGDGVGRGYLNNAELTMKKFVADPFRPSGRMYRTGDLGRRHADGNIEYLGRMDDQIKINGVRIEVGEVEFALMSHQAVNSAFVTVRKKSNGDKELVAYFVCKETVHIEDLRVHISAILPSFFLPDYLVPVDEFPLTPSGKIDKSRLPTPEQTAAVSGSDFIPPISNREMALVQIWQEILGRDGIGMNDNFFDRGGNSLKATRLLMNVNKFFNVSLSLKDIFMKPVVKDQLALVEQSQHMLWEIPVAVPADSYPLSSSQRSIYVVSQFDNMASAAYNMFGVHVLEGDVDPKAIEYALFKLIERHEVLRTVFREDARGAVREYILPINQTGFRLFFEDLRTIDDGDIKLRDHLDKDTFEPFNLAEGSILRASLYRLRHNRWMFSYCMHHIVSDAWSMKIWISELFHFYREYNGEVLQPLKPLRIQYKDYALWQQQRMVEGVFDRQRAYWLQQLGGEFPATTFPLDKVRPLFKSYHGNIVRRQINATEMHDLLTICRDRDATLFMGLLSLVSILFYKYSNQEEVIVGTSTSGRQHIDLQDQIGCYLNLLALKVKFSNADSFIDLLRYAKKVTQDAYANQDYPFENLTEDLRINQQAGRNTIFDVLLVLKSYEINELMNRLPANITVSNYDERAQHTSKFDLSFVFFEDAGALQLDLEYNSDLFHPRTITTLADRMAALLAAVIKDPHLPINRLEYPAGHKVQTSSVPEMNEALFKSEIDTEF